MIRFNLTMFSCYVCVVLPVAIVYLQLHADILLRDVRGFTSTL